MDAFTLFHVFLSLVGILSGLVVVFGLIVSHRVDRWTLVFLVTTALTSLTGFLFPFHGPTPAIVLGVLSLIALAAVIAGRYAFHFAGPWRWIYVIGAVLALYFNVFVLIVQSFVKVSALHALAPGNPPSGPVFGAVQLVVLAGFGYAGYRALRQFRPG
jgi:hypothetical protein